MLISNHNEKMNKMINRLSKKQKLEIKNQKEKEFLDEQSKLEALAGGFEKIFPVEFNTETIIQADKDRQTTNIVSQIQQ